MSGPSQQSLSRTWFERRFFMLMLATWAVPPLLGYAFLDFIGMFTLAELLAIVRTPVEGGFVLGSVLIALAYFRRYMAPVVAWVGTQGTDPGRALGRLRGFPFHFWTLFLGYVLLAPMTVIWAAQEAFGFMPTPADWLRIHLVALIVSIIVGLPLFFRILDLFGRIIGEARLERPHVTLKIKVFLIGTLTPLLVDTVLVQYYWTTTGYFGVDTFLVWLTLEALAVAGSLMFVRSLGQSLAPLSGVLHSRQAPVDELTLVPQSTDELGVLAGAYRRLLADLRFQGQLLRVSNRVLRTMRSDTSFAGVAESIIEQCKEALGCDQAYLFIHDPKAQALVGVVQAGRLFRPRGYVTLPLDVPSLAGWVLERRTTAAVPDVLLDERASGHLRSGIGIRAAIFAPMLAEGRALGVLVVTEPEPRPFTPEDVRLLEAFAREAALVVHTHMLREQRAEAEEARLEREQQVNLLLRSTAEAIFGVDLNGTCTFVNRACLEMLGYEHESDIIGKNLHALIHHTYPDGEPYPKEQCRVRAATLSGRSGHCDTEVHWRADGTPIPVEWWSHPVRKDGEVIGTVVTFVDISERKRAEEELRRLGEYNQLLLQSTSDGIFGVDRDLRCTFANSAAAEMLGFDAAALEGQDMHALVHHSGEDGAPLPREENLIQRAMAEDRSVWSNNEVLWKHGEDAFPVQYSANPLHEEGRVTGAVVVFRNVAEARAMARKMDYLATHDPLTGLVNRREFERRLGAALETARAQHGEHILCYVDLDQFKVVNDTCGHVAGDELLRQITILMHPRMRQSDTLARLGGDEFGMLFEHCPMERAVERAQDIWNLVQEFRFVWDNKSFSVGVSIGVVAITAETESADAALSAADAACYMAKDSGRNRVHVYEVNDAEIARRRGEMQWVSRLRNALDDDRFELCVQRLVPVAADAQDGGLLAEVLVRMRDEQGESVPPGAFLPAAERYNLVPDIDRWVVRRTFAYLLEHPDVFADLRLCTINLSGHSLGDESFAEFVVESLTSQGIDPERICFEITETAAVANLTQAVRFMRRMKAHGCSFALDDFGSGMSSFAYLKTLPVDFLKIDGNFVRDLGGDPIDRAMVEAINKVGHVMGIRTIAEFVESAEILEHLRDIGVDFAQGYGIARPEPMDDLIARRRAVVSDLFV